MLNIETIKPHMPVVCSEGGQFAVVDHLQGATSIKLAKDKSGQHHYIPVSWVTRVDDHVHIDRPGDEAMRQWTTKDEGAPLVHKDPSWWTETHSTGWQRTGAALRRDWEQTKADFGAGGFDLDQDVGDTLKQASGKEVIPPGTMPNPGRAADWDENEPALRYGYGAGHYYPDNEWNEELEGKLRKDWDSTGSSSSWERVKAAVRRGWQSVKQVAK
jgi:hypothetical protein